MIRYAVLLFILSIVLVYIAVISGILNTSPFEYIQDNRIDMEYDNIHIGIQNRYPLHNDKIWIAIYNGDFKIKKRYLFDLKKENVVGVLEGLSPFLYNDDEFAAIKLFSRSFPFFGGSHDRGTEELELVSLHSGISKILGEIPFGVASSGNYSPNRRYYQFNSRKNGNYLIDFKDQELLTLNLKQMDIIGWWSHSELVYIDKTFNIVKKNIEIDTEEILFTPNQIQNFIHENQLQITHPEDFIIETHWNGQEYEFLILHRIREINPNVDREELRREKWLLKIDKNTKTLKLFHTDFPYRWQSSYTTDLRKCVNTKGKSIFVLDTFTNVETCILTEHFTQDYIRPAFIYQNKILYPTSRELMMMDMDGTNNRQLFPPTVDTKQKL